MAKRWSRTYVRRPVSALTEHAAVDASIAGKQDDPYRRLVDGIIDHAIYMLDVDGTILSWNSGAQRLKGYRAAEIVGQSFATFYTRTDVAKGEPQRALANAAKNGKFESEGWRVRKDGSRFWASIVIDALRDADGHLSGFAKVTRDVTERTIREQQRQIIVEAAPNGILLVDQRECIEYANAQIERLLRSKPGALQGKPLGSVLVAHGAVVAVTPPGEAGSTAESPLSSHAPQHMLGMCADGSAIDVEVTFNTTTTARGEVIVASVVDISERLRVQAEQARSEAALLEANRLMTMAESMAQYGHWRYDLRTGEMFWSDEIYRARGMPKTHKPSFEGGLENYESSRAEVAAIFQSAMLDGRPFNYEARIKHTNGTLRDVRVGGRGEFDGEALIALAGIYQDVTDLKDAQRERDRLVERVTLATQAGKVGIWEWDIAAESMVWDARMFALFGLSERDVVASYAVWIDSIHIDDRAYVMNEIADALAGRSPLDTEFRVVWPNGDIYILRAQATVLRDASARALRMVGTLWDVTEVRTLSAQLREEKERQEAYERERLYEHERKWSATFQRAVLPLALPHVHGCTFDAVYEPGLADAQVGGDWYDAMRLIDGRILVSIGDVAGNGLEAAVVVGVVRQIIRGIAQLHDNPMLILDAADRALALEYPGVYVTAWIGIVDLVCHTITYASAGHPPPLLIARDTTVRELTGTTLPIGLREGHQGHALTVDVADGDTLVLYTDGVTEASRDVIAGTNALWSAAASLADAGVLERPARHIASRVIPDGSHDDVAILVVRIDFSDAERHIVRWEFDATDAAAASAARSRFLELLDPRQYTASDLACAELVFGELVGNVVRHAGHANSVEIVVDRGGPRTTLHVMDRGVGFRHISRLPPDLYAETGRGLFLIATLTAEFSVAERPQGGSHARAVLLHSLAKPLEA